MAEGDIGYDRDTGEWVTEGPPDKDGDPTYTVLDNFVPSPEQIARAAGYTGAWPIPDYAEDSLTPTLVKKDSGLRLQEEWLRYAKEQGIQSVPGAPLRFRDKSKAEAEAAANGGTVVRGTDGFWHVEDTPATKKTYPGQVIRGETIGGPPGSYFLQDPSGNLTPYTLPSTPFTDRLSPLQAAQLIAQAVAEVGSGGGGGISLEEARELFTALTTGPSGQAAASFGPGPNGEPGNINIGGFYGPTPPQRTLVPGAAGPGGELGNVGLPFPAFPDTFGTGPVPGGTGPAVPASFGATADPNAALANYLATKGQGTLTPPVGFQGLPTPPVADIFAEAARVASFQGLSPEQYDSNYESASPEAQAQIRVALAKQQIGGNGSSQAQATTAPGEQGGEGQTGYDVSQSSDFLAALRAREKQLRGPITSADIGAGATPGPAGQVVPSQTFQEAYEAQGGGNRQGVFQVPQGMNPFDAAIRLGQTPQGLATTAAINAVTPEERKRMAEEAMASPGYIGASTSPAPDSFQAALLKIANLRYQEQQKQRALRSGGRTVFA